MVVQKFREHGEIVVLGNEVFATGTHRGEGYTEADLADMVANFERFSSGDKPLVRVPAVLGHEETQEFLERSDLPAGAWAKRVYVEDGTFKVDWGEMAPAVAKLIKGKAYRTVSAEIYDEPPAGCEGGKGKMLRRVAFLGGDIPQVKTLADIPAPEFREASERISRLVLKSVKRSPSRGTFTVFSEVSMNRDQMLEALAALGYDVAKISKATSDEALAEILIMCQAKSGTATPAPEPKPEEKPPEDKPKEMAEPVVSTPTPTPPAREPSTVTLKYSELQTYVQQAVDKAVKGLGDKVERIDKFTEERLVAEKKASIKSRLDALVAAGKVLPAERDAGLDETLLAVDAVKVHKFSEKGKTVERTALDQQFATLEARPVLVSFAERMKVGATGAKATEEEEVAKVTRFSEDAKFSSALKATGKSPEQYVAAFKEARKKKPSLTAKEYGVPAEYTA